MKMSQLKMAIREVVREEIRLGLKEIIGELKQPTNEVDKRRVNLTRFPLRYAEKR